MFYILINDDDATNHDTKLMMTYMHQIPIQNVVKVIKYIHLTRSAIFGYLAQNWASFLLHIYGWDQHCAISHSAEYLEITVKECGLN